MLPAVSLRILGSTGRLSLRSGGPGVKGRRFMTQQSHQQSTAAQTIDFLTLVQSLKITKRTGWLRMGINGPESIADHMYRMGLMAMVVHAPGVDMTKCVKLALAHDIAEAIVGDIAPSDGVSKEEKNRRETEAMEKIQDILGRDTVAGTSIRALWQEYEDAETPEAKLVKDFDKLELIQQAQEYEASQGTDLEEFFTSTEGKFNTEVGKALAAEIISRRQKKG
jgi:putative hydrolase of HD superfamily